MSLTTVELLKILNSKNSIDDYLEAASEEMNQDTLPEYLEKCIARSGLSKSQIIRRSGLDRIYAYQIFSGKKQNPVRDKLIRLAFGMKLTIDDTQNLLKTAGKSPLSPRNQRDSIILFALLHQANVINCDELLEAKGESILR